MPVSGFQSRAFWIFALLWWSEILQKNVGLLCILIWIWKRVQEPACFYIFDVTMHCAVVYCRLRWAERLHGAKYASFTLIYKSVSFAKTHTIFAASETLEITRDKGFCLLGRYAVKIYRIIILPVVCMGVKLGRWHWGRNVGWGCLRIGCWKYFGLRGMREQGMEKTT
jgi:hypothetical protein